MQRSTLVPAAGSLVAIALACLAPGVARADDEPVTYAVQNREFPIRHELTASVGVLPVNAFTKGITLGVGYTYHFTPTWSWEVAQFAYSFGIDTALKQELLSNFQVQPTQIEQLELFLSSNVVATPLYGKLALVNRWVVHLEFFLDAGPALGRYLNPTVWRGGFDAGGGFRFFVNQLFSVRVEVRDYTFFKGASPASEMYIGLAAALSFGGGAR